MKVPFIHQTDLFRPHNDPDDHWDLATLYALGATEYLDPIGVLIDSPLIPDRIPMSWQLPR